MFYMCKAGEKCIVIHVFPLLYPDQESVARRDSLFSLQRDAFPLPVLRLGEFSAVALLFSPYSQQQCACSTRMLDCCLLAGFGKSIE